MIWWAWLKLLGALSLDQLSLWLPQDFWLHLGLHKRLRYTQGPFMRTLVSNLKSNFILVARNLFSLHFFSSTICWALISSFLLSIQFCHWLGDNRALLMIRSYFHFCNDKFLILLCVGVLMLASATTTMRHTIKVILKAGNPWFQITLQATFILACALQDIWCNLATSLDAREVVSAIIPALLDWTNFVKVQLFGCSFYFILSYLILSYAIVYLW